MSHQSESTKEGKSLRKRTRSESATQAPVKKDKGFGTKRLDVYIMKQRVSNNESNQP